MHELRVSGRCPSPVSTDAGTDNAALEEQEGSTDAVDAADGADIMVGLANDLDNLKVSPPPRPSVCAPTIYHERLPTNSPLPSMPQMSSNDEDKPFLGAKIGGSPTPWLHGSPTPSVGYTSDSSFDGRVGTESNPIVVFADLENSEQNFPFDIIHVPRIEHGGWAREGIDIRMAVGVGDAECWEAWMDDSLPHHQDNVIMVRGRSRSSDYDALDSYHRGDNGSDASAVHHRQLEDIKRNPSRQTLYWRIITPNSMPLDNVILSGDSKKILKKEKGVKRTLGENQDIVVLSYFVNWVIAKKKTGHQIASAPKMALEDAFA